MINNARASFTNTDPFFSSQEFVSEFEVTEGQSVGVNGTGIFDCPAKDFGLGDYSNQTEEITLQIPSKIAGTIRKNDIISIKDDPNRYKVIKNHPDGTGVSTLHLVHLGGKLANVGSRD